ncbi:MAG: HDOD domain-containing protein [Chitinivibrionales bacterium]|nr:HDOD domain-containing protein [Chitinivibrionales bacterium]
MISLMLVAENERESQVLKMAFEQRNIKVIPSKPTYANYIKLLQYLPDVVLIEIPRVNMAQLKFTDMMRQHKKMKKVPLLGYGDKIEEGVKRGIATKGIINYFERPLKFTALITIIGSILKQFQKSLDEKPPEPGIEKEKAATDLLNPQIPAAQKIELVRAFVSKLLAFPFTIAKVLQLAESEKSGAADLARVITADPVISAQIFKVCNSVLFASLNRRISTIRDAIVRIGFRETKNIVMGMSVLKLFDEKNQSLGFDKVDFWYHSLACGIIAEKLAKQMGTINAEEAFLAGLLHDFGIMIFSEYFPTVFSKLLEETTTKACQFIDTEKKILGITHNEAVKELFAGWKLPETISEAIVTQYDFAALKNGCETPVQKMALCVAVGNILAKTAFLGRECDLFVQPLENWVWDSFKMPLGFTAEHFAQINQSILLYREFLGLENREFPLRHEGIQEAEQKRIGIGNLAGHRFMPPLIYFQKQGFKVELFNHTSALSACDRKYDAIILWGGPDLTVEMCQTFMRIAQYTAVPPAAADAVKFAPVIACADKEASLFKQPKTPGLRILENHLDLRELERTVMQQLMPAAEPLPVNS